MSTPIRLWALAPVEDEWTALMIGYQRGDAEAFEVLYASLAPVLRRCLATLARDASWVDDLLQETFLQMHRARHTYNPAFPVRPWALAIARHVFLMNRRARLRRRDFDDRHTDDLNRVSRPGHEHAYLMKDRLERGLAILTPGTRRAVILHHALGFSFAEVGRALGIRETAAKLRVSRAVARTRCEYTRQTGSGDVH